VTFVTLGGVTNVTFRPVTNGTLRGLPRRQDRPRWWNPPRGEEVETVPEKKKIAPKAAPAKAKSTSKAPATRVTKKLAHKKVLKKT